MILDLIFDCINAVLIVPEFYVSGSFARMLVATFCIICGFEVLYFSVIESTLQ